MVECLCLYRGYDSVPLHSVTISGHSVEDTWQFIFLCFDATRWKSARYLAIIFTVITLNTNQANHQEDGKILPFFGSLQGVSYYREMLLWSGPGIPAKPDINQNGNYWPAVTGSVVSPPQRSSCWELWKVGGQLADNNNSLGRCSCSHSEYSPEENSVLTLIETSGMAQSPVQTVIPLWSLSCRRMT